MNKNNLLSRSRYFYKCLLSLNFTENDELSHYMERSWYYIPRL